MRYIEGLLHVIHFLASPLSFPVKDGEALDIPALNTWLVNEIVKNPDFEFSQRIVDLLVEGSRGLFVTHLQPHMMFFGVRPAGDKSTVWKSQYKSYSDSILSQVDGWVATDQVVNDSEPLSESERHIMSLIKPKLKLILKHSLLTDGYPLLPSFTGAKFPLLCPEFLICLMGELRTIEPLLRLVCVLL